MAYDIKSNRPNKRAKTQQGYFPISECRKYRGRGPIVYRSSWERMFCEYCERSPEIQWWSSESISIPYFNPFDGKDHRYFPDFVLGMTDGRVIIVEVKPGFQLVAPKPPKRKDPRALKRYQRDLDTYRSVMLKRIAAKEYASRRGATYMLVTEKFFVPS